MDLAIFQQQQSPKISASWFEVVLTASLLTLLPLAQSKLHALAPASIVMTITLTSSPASSSRECAFEPSRIASPIDLALSSRCSSMILVKAIARKDLLPTCGLQSIRPLSKRKYRPLSTFDRILFKSFRVASFAEWIKKKFAA